MTKEQILKAFEMRVDNYTYQEIADTLGYSKQNVQQCLSSIISEYNGAISRKSVYPNLSYEISLKFKSMRMFCETVGFKYVHFRQMIIGQIKPSVEDVKECCQYFNKDVLYLFEKRSDNNAE